MKLVCTWLLLWQTAGFWGPVTPPPPTFAVRVMVVDAAGQPVSDLGLELVVIQYGEMVALFWAGACETDRSGACLIMAAFPPSTPPDWYEGVVYVGDLGRQLVGWHGAEAFLLIELAADGRVPTEGPALHPPYEQQDETATERVPGSTPTTTHVPLTTLSPEPTKATPTRAVTNLPPLLLTPASPPAREEVDMGLVMVLSVIAGGVLIVLFLSLRRKKE